MTTVYDVAYAHASDQEQLDLYLAVAGIDYRLGKLIA